MRTDYKQDRLNITKPPYDQYLRYLRDYIAVWENAQTPRELRTRGPTVTVKHNDLRVMHHRHANFLLALTN